MTLARDTSATARQVQLDALRRLDGSTRLVMACQMSDEARAISEAGIRHRHPDWADDQVHQALLELLLGPDATRTVLESRLMRA
jgi:hypothetical protein